MVNPWVSKARQLFQCDKPAHFTNYRHCEECAEHDQTLLTHSLDQLGMAQLGNPGWDPLCFCSSEGKRYLMPALVRLSLETVDDEFYFEQLLFHLEGAGPGHDFYLACTPVQRQFVADFTAYMIEHFTDQLDVGFCADQVLRVYELWQEG